MNWDDLRIVRAVFQTGSFAAASRILKINETTVSRRLSRLQDDLGVVLFEAVDGARVPTADCERIAALTERIKGCTDRIEEIAQVRRGHTEKRRIAATDSIAAEVLAPQVPALLAAHPELELEFLASTENVDFSRWQADLAIRLKRPEKGNFLISKLAELPLYWVEPVARSKASSPWVCAYPEALDDTPESRYLNRLGVLCDARFLSKNLLVIKRLVISGQCSAVLPAYLCEDLLERPDFTFTRLRRGREAWLLRQSHLRNDPATLIVSDWIKSCFAALSSPP